MTWTKERIHALLDNDPRAVLRACLAIYDRQTASEQETQTTSNRNGIGFGAYDAQFCSDIAQRALRARSRGWNFTLTPKQLAVLRNKMKHYHRQLAEIANEKEAAKIGQATPEAAELVAVDTRTPEQLRYDAEMAEEMNWMREIQAGEANEERRRMAFKFACKQMACRTLGLRAGDHY